MSSQFSWQAARRTTQAYVGTFRGQLVSTVKLETCTNEWELYGSLPSKDWKVCLPFPRIKCIPKARLQPPGYTHIQNSQVPGHGYIFKRCLEYLANNPTMLSQVGMESSKLAHTHCQNIPFPTGKYRYRYTEALTALCSSEGFKAALLSWPHHTDHTDCAALRLAILQLPG